MTQKKLWNSYNSCGMWNVMLFWEFLFDFWQLWPVSKTAQPHNFNSLTMNNFLSHNIDSPTHNLSHFSICPKFPLQRMIPHGTNFSWQMCLHKIRLMYINLFFRRNSNFMKYFGPKSTLGLSVEIWTKIVFTDLIGNISWNSNCAWKIG